MHRTTLSLLALCLVLAACSDPDKKQDAGAALDTGGTVDTSPAQDSGGGDAMSPDQSQPQPDQSQPQPDQSPPKPDKGSGGGCKVDCDCAQGLMCIGGGKCIAGFVPVYCCTKSGCKPGWKCTNPDGSSGTCP